MRKEVTLEEATEQFMNEASRGRVPGLEEFSHRYPHLRGELENVLPLLSELHSMAGAAPEDEELYFDSLLPDDSDFRILRKISNGGMGIVFEGTQLSLNRRVAIKFLSSLLLNDEKQREQFRCEAQLIAQLHHPNIVKVLSANCNVHYCFYVMEFVEGLSLTEKKIKEKQEIARIGLSAAQALAYAHNCGIVHRDVKPSNILIDESGVVKVCDFGLAANACRGDLSPSEEPGGGTFRYMAPEQILHGTVSFAADQYALGATLYECLTGEPLYTCCTREQLKDRMERGDFACLKENDDLSCIINKTIAPTPEARYPHLSDLVEDLQNYLHCRPITACPAGIARKLTLWMKRKPTAAAFALVSCMLATSTIIAGGVGYYKTREALRYAEANAAQADDILAKVFETLPGQQPTRLHSKLLSTLMPYYRSLIRSNGIPEEKQKQAYRILAECARRCGDIVGAEHAARQLVNLEKNAENLNMLAVILHSSGKRKEAESLYREVVRLYADASAKNEKSAVVTALLALSDNPQSDEYKQALTMLQQLVAESAQNPEYRFRFACLLVAYPSHRGQIRVEGVESNATGILQDLVKQYPENVEYATELIRMMTRRIRANTAFADMHQEQVADIILLSERMLARYPGDTRVLEAALQLHRACLRAYRDSGRQVEARKRADRMLGIVEFLFHNQDLTNEARLLIIELQWERAEMLQRGGSTESAAELLEKIRNELPYTHGEKSEQMRKKLGMTETAG